MLSLWEDDVKIFICPTSLTCLNRLAQDLRSWGLGLAVLTLVSQVGAVQRASLKRSPPSSGVWAEKTPLASSWHSWLLRHLPLSLWGPPEGPLHTVASWKLDFLHLAENAQSRCSKKTQQKPLYMECPSSALYPSRQSQRPPRCKEKGPRLPLLIGGVSKNVWTCFKTASYHRCNSLPSPPSPHL